MSRIVFDEPAWWRRPGLQLASAALLALLALIVWWSVLTPVDHDPIVVRAPATPVTPVARAAPPPALSLAPLAQPLAAPPVPATPATPPLSTMVAPGVHVTPLGVPHGAVPLPAGPKETDSEPEN
ncbi:MAG TPA: hypothetical protein VF107_13065 [Burkholderiaceae bacterium]